MLVMDETVGGKSAGESRSAGMRRKIYIKERLPAVLSEMKSLADEKKELGERRKLAKPEDRRQINHRWSFVVERMAVLRAERAALIDERDGMSSQPERAKE